MKYGSKTIKNTTDFLELFLVYYGNKQDNYEQEKSENGLKIVYFPYHYDYIFNEMYKEALDMKDSRYKTIMTSLKVNKNNNVDINGLFQSFNNFNSMHKTQWWTEVAYARIAVQLPKEEEIEKIKLKYTEKENKLMDILTDYYKDIDKRINKKQQLTKVKKHNTIKL